jgi:NAD(P)-dependent dehydrogenase (short-subunit alcohol dehydrogenase family)
MTVDVTDENQVDSAIQELASLLGGIDILINNAGAGCSKGPMHEQSAESLRKLLDLNVVAVASVSGAVLRHAMLGQGKGHIINISSKAGKVGLAGMGPYVASKFALEGLTATLAAELTGTGISVNSISPGMVDTKAFPKAPGRPGVRTAESVADGLLHILASGQTGKYLHVDEFDQAREAGVPDAALKQIDEPQFDPGSSCAAP